LIFIFRSHYYYH